MFHLVVKEVWALNFQEISVEGRQFVEFPVLDSPVVSFNRKHIYYLYLCYIIFLLSFCIKLSFYYLFCVDIALLLICAAIKSSHHNLPKVFKKAIPAFGSWANYWYTLQVMNINWLIQDSCGFNPKFFWDIKLFLHKSQQLWASSWACRWPMCWKLAKHSN